MTCRAYRLASPCSPYLFSNLDVLRYARNTFKGFLCILILLRFSSLLSSVFSSVTTETRQLADLRNIKMNSVSGVMSPSANSPPSPFKLDAVLTEASLDAYLNGILNTILFVRLLGLLEPLENVPLSQHSFHGIAYPVIRDTTTLRNPAENRPQNYDDDLLNRSPREWTASKVGALMKSFREKRPNKRKTQSPIWLDMFMKVVVVLKLYDATHPHHNNNTNNGNINSNSESGDGCWEIWVLDLDVLANTEKTTTTIANPIDRTTNTNTTNRTATATATDRSKDTGKLYDFFSLDAHDRLGSMESSFRSNMFQIIKYADSNTDNIPGIRTQSLNPFSIRTEFWVKPNHYTSAGINNPSGELDLDFNSLNISLIMGDSALSQESMEYINTTENGEVVISSGSGSGSGSKSDNETNANRVKDDLWKNGYNFFKKMLE